MTLPSAIWRILMILDLLPGTDDLQRLHAGEHGYVWGLSVVQVACGALCLGLAQRWGERIAGVPIPRWVPVVLGGLGGLAVTWLFTIRMTGQIFGGARPDQYTVHGVPLAIMMAAYLPILAWGPLTLVAVVGYWMRRR
ncbi:hypothetical protein [Mariniluteicoccus flavus]